MDIIMDGGPRIEWKGNDIKVVEKDLDADWGPCEVIVTLDFQGIVIDAVDMDSGEVVGTEAATWDELLNRIIN